MFFSETDQDVLFYAHYIAAFLLSLLTNIDYEQSSTMSRLDLAINMQH